jgi:hypothetical protein
VPIAPVPGATLRRCASCNPAMRDRRWCDAALRRNVKPRRS